MDIEQFNGGVSSDMEGLEEKDLVGKELEIKGFEGRELKRERFGVEEVVEMKRFRGERVKRKAILYQGLHLKRLW